MIGFMLTKKIKRFRPSDYNGFDIIISEVYDDALDALKEEVQQYQPSRENELIVIEFARCDYQHALEQLGRGFIQKLIFSSLMPTLKRAFSVSMNVFNIHIPLMTILFRIKLLNAMINPTMSRPIFFYLKQHLRLMMRELGLLITQKTVMKEIFIIE